MASKMHPQYPEIRVRTSNPNPLVLVAEVRQAMRHAAVGSREIDRFTSQALEQEDSDWRETVCREWVTVA